MAPIPTEVRKAVPAPVGRDPFHALRMEMNWLFDCFAEGFAFEARPRSGAGLAIGTMCGRMESGVVAALYADARRVSAGEIRRLAG